MNPQRTNAPIPLKTKQGTVSSSLTKEKLQESELKYLEALANAEKVRRELALNKVGSFQIIHHPEVVKASYLLDTETGKAW